MFFSPLLVFLLALVAYILWWLRSNLFKISFGNKIFFVRFFMWGLWKAVVLSCLSYIVVVFWRQEKNGGCAGLYGQCSKGVAFLPETRFLTVLFCFLRFLVPVPHFGPPVTRFAGVDIDAENAFTIFPHLFVFLLLLKQYAFCSISQEWCSLLFQARNFPRIVCFKLRLTLFCSNGRLASMLPKGNRSGPLWRTTQSCDFFF